MESLAALNGLTSPRAAASYLRLASATLDDVPLAQTQLGQMDGHDTFVQSAGMRSTRHIDGLTIMNAATGAYYALSETAAFIWEQLRGPTSIARIKASVAERYQVSIDQLDSQIEEFTQELAAEGLVQRAEARDKGDET